MILVDILFTLGLSVLCVISIVECNPLAAGIAGLSTVYAIYNSVNKIKLINNARNRG